MKKLLLTLATLGFLASQAAFAEDTAPGAAPQPTPAPTEQQQAPSAQPAPKSEKKMSVKAARKACKEQGLKGKELRKCMKEHLKK